MISAIRESSETNLAGAVLGAACAHAGFRGDPLALQNPAIRAVEISAESRPSPDVLKRFAYVHAGELMIPEQASALVHAPYAARRESLDFLMKTIREFSVSGVHTGALDPLLTPENMNAVLHYLKMLEPVLTEQNFTLLLPFNLPNRNGIDAYAMTRFLRATLHPGIRVRLDIHVHECRREETPEKLAGPLLSEVRSVHFIYNSDSGNTLIREHIRPWADSLTVFGFRGPFFTVPVSAGGNAFIPQAELFASLAGQNNTNSKTNPTGEKI